MKKLLIFEGIASSGKTTLERLLHGKLPDSEVISEEETLMPLIENRDTKIAVNHLRSLIEGFQNRRSKTLIVDRFYWTHAFRTNADLSAFKEIEEDLMKNFLPVIIFLKIDENMIRDRIQETAARRGSAWAKGKQGSLEERVAYYKNQQATLTSFVEESNTPAIVVDTTDKDWNRCLKEILTALPS